MKFLNIFLLFIFAATAQGAIIADHQAVAQFDNISETVFQGIRDNYSFFYGHTSHGSQIMTGIGMLADENSSLYASPYIHEISSDLGHNGSLVWEGQTRDWLGSHEETNVVMWSWCGGCSDNTVAGINIYLDAMNQLELDYPNVIFIYMTGHLDGTGVDGVLYRSNNQIRDYCLTNGKILFDFADIESWDPDGNYYPDETDACSWCSDWCAVEACPSCGSCAHSHCFNCYQKGKVFWSMFAEIFTTRLSGVGDQAPRLSSVLNQNHPNPFNPRTEISVDVKQPGTGALVVYDLAGRKVETLYEGSFTKGSHSFFWNGSAAEGDGPGSGVYFCRLRIGSEVQEIKMTLLK